MRGGARALLGVAGVLSVLVCVVVIAAVSLGVTVDGVSMRPTLRTGDRLIPDPFDRTPTRGQLVDVQPPGAGARVVKRVIGLPGDRVAIVGSYAATQSPAVLIQPQGRGPWQVLLEPYVASWRTPDACCTTHGTSSARPTEVTVPPGQYFVLGDNRDRSVDSRRYGFVPAADVHGVILWRVWPIHWPLGGVGGGSPRLAPSTAQPPEVSP